MKENHIRMLLVLAACAVSTLLLEPRAAAQRNIIQIENEKPGTTDWMLREVKRQDDELYQEGWRRRKMIEGYTSHTSIRPGETLKVFVNTVPAAKYRVDIYRMGYYRGTGARLMTSLGPYEGAVQPEPVDGERNLIECHWKEGFSFAIPKDWVSGVYLGKLTTLKRYNLHEPDALKIFESYVVFIVRDDRNADLLFQCSDMTWQSYNRWPQWRSMYDTIGSGRGNIPKLDLPREKRFRFFVGWDRPYGLVWNGFPVGFNPLTNGSGEFVVQEFPLAFWLEEQGYDVTYISNFDTHTDGKGLLRGKVFLSVGHDEYWTMQMYQNVTKARDAGVNLAFLSGNSVSGVVDLRPSTDGRPNRVMRPAVTEPEMVRPGFGELAADLMGARSYGVGFTDWTCDKPEHWVFEGSGMKKGDRVSQLVGWEYHGLPLKKDPSLVVLSQGPVYNAFGVLGKGTYATTIYTAPKGNLVFDAATCWWNMVLSTPPGFDNPPRKYFLEEDKRVQRITKNILDRMISTKVARTGP